MTGDLHSAAAYCTPEMAPRMFNLRLDEGHDHFMRRFGHTSFQMPPPPLFLNSQSDYAPACRDYNFATAPNNSPIFMKRSIVHNVSRERLHPAKEILPVQICTTAGGSHKSRASKCASTKQPRCVRYQEYVAVQKIQGCPEN
jgi:hypothetical protein